MTDKVYNILKYCALIAIPAIGTFYTTIASLWGWSYITEVSGTILAFDTLLGAFIGFRRRGTNRPRMEFFTSILIPRRRTLR